MRILAHFEVVLCNFCMVDFGSTDPTFFGLARNARIGFESMQFLQDVPVQIGKDLFCSACQLRLAFLRLVTESRDLFANEESKKSKPSKG